MSQRTDRVDELLRQEIGALLAKEIADPRIGFATITDVETAPDLRHAKVWVSVIGDKGEAKETLRALQRSMPFIRHELGKRLRIRRIPELHVQLDDTAERGTRVLHLLQELEAGVDPESIQPLQESLPTPVRRLPHEGDAEEPADEEGGDPAADGSARPGEGQGRQGRSLPRGERPRGTGPRTRRGGPPGVDRRKPKRSPRR
jgi:ribosome-binding factor A